MSDHDADTGEGNDEREEPESRRSVPWNRAIGFLLPDEPASDETDASDEPDGAERADAERGGASPHNGNWRARPERTATRQPAEPNQRAPASGERPAPRGRDGGPSGPRGQESQHVHRAGRPDRQTDNPPDGTPGVVKRYQIGRWVPGGEVHPLRAQLTRRQVRATRRQEAEPRDGGEGYTPPEDVPIELASRPEGEAWETSGPWSVRPSEAWEAALHDRRAGSHERGHWEITETAIDRTDHVETSRDRPDRDPEPEQDSDESRVRLR